MSALKTGAGTLRPPAAQFRSNGASYARTCYTSQHQIRVTQVRELRAVLWPLAGDDEPRRMVSLANLRLPKTTPSCANGGRDEPPQGDLTTFLPSTALVAASRGGVHIADFPSTWDELT